MRETACSIIFLKLPLRKAIYFLLFPLLVKKSIHLTDNNTTPEFYRSSY